MAGRKHLLLTHKSGINTRASQSGYSQIWFSLSQGHIMSSSRALLLGKQRTKVHHFSAKTRQHLEWAGRRVELKQTEVLVGKETDKFHGPRWVKGLLPREESRVGKGKAGPKGSWSSEKWLGGHGEGRGLYTADFRTNTHSWGLH